MVSTHLKNISQIGSFPQVGVKTKNIWNHHLVQTSDKLALSIQRMSYILDFCHSGVVVVFVRNASLILDKWAHKSGNKKQMMTMPFGIV